MSEKRLFIISFTTALSLLIISSLCFGGLCGATVNQVLLFDGAILGLFGGVFVLVSAINGVIK